MTDTYFYWRQPHRTTEIKINEIKKLFEDYNRDERIYYNLISKAETVELSKFAFSQLDAIYDILFRS